MPIYSNENGVLTNLASESGGGSGALDSRIKLLYSSLTDNTTPIIAGELGTSITGTLNDYYKASIAKPAKMTLRASLSDAKAILIVYKPVPTIIGETYDGSDWKISIDGTTPKTQNLPYGSTKGNADDATQIKTIIYPIDVLKEIHNYPPSSFTQQTCGYNNMSFYAGSAYTLAYTPADTEHLYINGSFYLPHAVYSNNQNTIWITAYRTFAIYGIY